MHHESYPKESQKRGVGGGYHLNRTPPPPLKIPTLVFSFHIQALYAIIRTNMSLLTSKKQRDSLDRVLLERDLAARIAHDLPDLYERALEIATRGEDSDSLKAILALFDRLLGKTRDPSEQPKQAVTINVFNPAGGSVDDYKITRYGKNLGETGDLPADEPIDAEYSPVNKTPTISSLPPSTDVPFNLADIKTPTPQETDL